MIIFWKTGYFTSKRGVYYLSGNGVINWGAPVQGTVAPTVSGINTIGHTIFNIGVNSMGYGINNLTETI